MDDFRRFDAAYREEVELEDGQMAVLRLVRPTDKELLLQGLARMSPEARYFRFMGPRRSLNASELRYLTEVDGENHFALGAVVVGADGREEGIGVARFIRLPGEPTVAEPAITVIDDYQGLGLGRVLLSRLVAAARERGVERFRCDFLAANRKIRGLFDQTFDTSCVVSQDAETVTMEFLLPTPKLGERLRSALDGTALSRAFAHAARGVLATVFGRPVTRQLDGETLQPPEQEP
jgi:GNAT superfamily N-acetyltransferase